MTAPTPGAEDRVRHAIALLSDVGPAIDPERAEDRLVRSMAGNRLRRRLQVVAVAAAAVLVVTLTGYAGTRVLGHEPDQPTRPAPSPTVEYRGVPSDLPALRADSSAPLPFAASDPPPTLGSGLGSVWVLGRTRLLRVDEATGRVTGQLPLSVTQIVPGGGAMYAATALPTGGSQLVRIDPGSLRRTVVHTYPLTVPGLAMQGSHAYAVLDGTPATVVDVDVATGESLTRPLPAQVVPAGGWNVAVGFGSVWVCAGQQLVRLDPATLQVQAVIQVDGALPEPRDPKSVFVGDGFVWLSNSFTMSAPDGSLLQLTPAGTVVAASRGMSGQVAFDAGSAWVGGRVSALRWDVGAHRYVASAAPTPPAVAGSDSVGTTVAGPYVWVADQQSLTRFRRS
jgi:hypothetical protein